MALPASCPVRPACNFFKELCTIRYFSLTGTTLDWESMNPKAQPTEVWSNGNGRDLRCAFDKIRMKRRLQLSLALLAWLSLAWPSRAAVLVDDTWADGSRAEQNLPAESAWFTTSVANMTASPGSLSVANLATSSSQWTTYFTEAGSPSQLNVGDTLTVTIAFTPSQVAAQNSSQNWRIALCDSSAGVRLAGDGGPNAANYTGYALFGNFGQTWGRNNGIDLRRRANLSNSGLLTTSGDWTSLGGGGTVTGDPAFTDGVPFTLTISVTRDSESSVTLTGTYSGGDLSSTWTATDVNTDTTSIYTKFDSVIFRPSRGDGTAMNFVFTRFKVEGPSPLPPPPSLVVEPQDRTLTVAETASLGVAASGGAPLQYQWYFNDVNTPVANASNASLLLTNIQTNQAGGYFVIVSNDQGVATSKVAMVTVNLPVFTSPGVVVDDIWEDGDRGSGNPVVSTNNSLWFASSATSLSAWRRFDDGRACPGHLSFMGRLLHGGPCWARGHRGRPSPQSHAGVHAWQCGRSEHRQYPPWLAELHLGYAALCGRFWHRQHRQRRQRQGIHADPELRRQLWRQHPAGNPSAQQPGQRRPDGELR